MDKIVDAANYIARQYKEVAGEILDELKLHKLLYFMQRESFAISDEPAFEGDFEGWKYGPVSPAVHAAFCNGEIIVPTEELSDRCEYIADDIIEIYGACASWKLSKMSHQEQSWQNARAGLAPNENGNRTIRLEDIREDAKKVPCRSYSPESNALFYSESNMAHLLRGAERLNAGKGTEHEIAEGAGA